MGVPASLLDNSLAFVSVRAAIARVFRPTPAFADWCLSSAVWLAVLLLFAVMFAPRSFLANLSGFYRIDLRAEDVLLPLVGILILFGMSRSRPLPEIPAVEKAFLFFLLAAQASIALGMVLGTIDKPLISFFTLTKWLQYLLVFMFISRINTGERAQRLLLGGFFALGLALSAYGYWEKFFVASRIAHLDYYRLYEHWPFQGDANHVGGFLALWICFFTGLFLTEKDDRKRSWLFAAIVFAFFPLIWTFSRKSYMALGGSLALGLLFIPHRKKILWLAASFMALGLLFPTGASRRLAEMAGTMASTDPYASSWAGNLSMWKRAFWNFDHFFVLGSGLGSRHRVFYESQWVQVLTETGIVGTTAFLILFLLLIREILRYSRKPLGPEANGMALGWTLAFLAILIHSTSCMSFMVAKIAVPFWFLTAVVLTGLKREAADLP